MANRFTERKRQARQQRYMDYTLIFVVLFLLAFGMVMIYSTSSYESQLQMGNSMFYLKKQIFATILGLIAMVVVSLIDYHVWEKIAMWAYAASFVAILAIIPLGYEANGAKRWIRIFGISLQPAEFVKIAMIVFLAGLICRVSRSALETWKGIGIIFLTAIPIFFMLWGMTDNMSSALIVLGIAALMIFVAAPDYRRFVMIAVAGIVLIILIVIVIKNTAGKGFGFRGERVLAWLDPEAYASGKGFQTLQALYAIGSGGIFGKGLGQSMQKLGFLPEAQNDMIFSIICEELGLIGAFTVMMLFIILLWRMMIVASNAPDLFGALLVVGVMGHIAIQVILNIAVVTNTIPNTGISLPFISYGGSASLFLLSEIGLVINVIRNIRLRDS